MAYNPHGAGALAPVNRQGQRPASHAPVYQIDFTAVASGKRIASTKRRVRWRWGFANQDALASGETGTACRGEEHDITLVWSVTSGKRLILADGQEVHYSMNRGNVLSFSWSMRGNHVLKVIAHASPPINATPGFRQYDFFVDGQSFFNFPKVYRLGLNQRDARHAAAHPSKQPYSNYTVPPETRAAAIGGGSNPGIATLETPHNPHEEEAYLKEAIKNSLEDAKEKAPAPAAQPKEAGEPLLLDFLSGGETPTPAPAPALPAPAVALPAPTPALALPPPAPAFPAPAPAFSAPAPALALPAPTPAPTAENGFAVAPQPTFSDITSEFPTTPAPSVSTPAPGLNASYVQPAAAPFPAPAVGLTASIAQPPAAPAPSTSLGQPPVAPAPASNAPFAQPPAPPAPALNASYSQTSAVFAVAEGNAPQPAAGTQATDPAAFTMGALSGQTPAPAPSSGTETGTSADRAYQNMMSDFDIGARPSSSAKPPASAAPAPTLAGLQSMGANKQVKQDIMKSPPPAAPGAMVLSSSQQAGNWSGYGQGAAPAMNQGMGQGLGQNQAPPVGNQYGGYGAPPPAAGGVYAQQQQQPQYYQQQQQQPQYYQQQQPAAPAPATPGYFQQQY